LDIQELNREYKPASRFVFDSNIKRASYVYSTANGCFAYTSGAPESILSRCTKVMTGESSDEPKSEGYSEIVREAVNEVAKLGERTIAIAYKGVKDRTIERDVADSDMTFIGMISFIDPPRKGVKEAVKLCQ
ncbi:P-type IID ATPase, partial [mine drainage metagenome]